MWRSVWLSVAVAIMVLMMVALPVFASYKFYYIVNVTDISGTDRTYVPAMLGFGGTAIYNAGYMTATGTDTQIASGSIPQAYLLSTTNVNAVIDNLPANSTVNLNFYTGYAPVQTAFPIVVGGSGYITTAHDAALEWGNDGGLDIKGYVDTTSGSSKNIVNKLPDYSLSVSGTNTIKAEIFSYSTLITTTVVDGSNRTPPLWGQTFTAISDDYVTRVQLYSGVPFTNIRVCLYAVAAGIPTGVPLSTSDLVSGGGASNVSVLLPPYKMTNGLQYAVIAIASDAGTWGSNPANPYAGGVLGSCTLGAGNVIATWTPVATDDFMLKIDTSPVCIATVTPAVRRIQNSLTGGTFSLTIDALAPITIAFAGSVPDTGGAWTIDQNNVMPYIEYYKHIKTGAEVVHYEPAAMITGTAVPDLHAPAQDGTITWGTNDRLIISLGEVNPYIGGSGVAVGEESGFTTPVSVMPPNWTASGDKLSSPPADSIWIPISLMLDFPSSSGGIPKTSMAILIYFMVVLGFTVTTLLKTKSMFITAVIMVVLLAIGSSLTLIPGWVVFVVGIGGIGLLFLYKQFG